MLHQLKNSICLCVFPLLLGVTGYTQEVKFSSSDTDNIYYVSLAKFFGPSFGKDSYYLEDPGMIFYGIEGLLVRNKMTVIGNTELRTLIKGKQIRLYRIIPFHY